jgi:surface antigen
MAAIAKSSGTAGTAKKAGAKKTGSTSTTAAKAKPISSATVKTAPTTASTPTPTKSRSARKAESNSDQRRYYIEVAAYYIAERRGFMGGHEEEDWTTAEVEIDQMLADGKLNMR